VAAILVVVAALAACAAGDSAPASAPVAASSAPASSPASAPSIAPGGVDDVLRQLPSMSTPGGTWSALQWVLLVTVLAVAPAVLVMVTSFTRVIVVLGLLRQALATQQLPPNQVLVGLALFITLAVMAPVIQGVWSDGVEPYINGRTTQAAAAGVVEGRLRGFMIGQIEAAHNTQDVQLFLSEDLASRGQLVWKDVPTVSLVPAFVISELKVAFAIGLRIFLPFLVIDMLVAAVLTSMGILMLPPVLVSLPFKLLLFVLVDGWHLVVGTLMRSFT
jgi:flagellar biosynthetic protein FliP